MYKLNWKWYFKDRDDYNQTYKYGVAGTNSAAAVRSNRAGAVYALRPPLLQAPSAVRGCSIAPTLNGEVLSMLGAQSAGWLRTQQWGATNKRFASLS